MPKAKEIHREKAIAALLASRNVEAAARKIGVSAKTLGRWMRDESFREAYQATKRDLLRAGVARLASKVFLAAETLGEVAKHKGREFQTARAHAATSIIKLSLDAEALDDLETRIRRLENQKPEDL
jgi:hypothetical protein